MEFEPFELYGGKTSTNAKETTRWLYIKDSDLERAKYFPLTLKYILDNLEQFKLGEIYGLWGQLEYIVLKTGKPEDVPIYIPFGLDDTGTFGKFNFVCKGHRKDALKAIEICKGKSYKERMEMGYD